VALGSVVAVAGGVVGCSGTEGGRAANPEAGTTESGQAFAEGGVSANAEAGTTDGGRTLATAVTCAGRSGTVTCGGVLDDGGANYCDRGTQLCNTGGSYGGAGCVGYGDVPPGWKESAAAACGACPTCDCLLDAGGVFVARGGCSDDDAGGLAVSAWSSCYGAPPARRRQPRRLDA
jgi:hypothetical protein